jgi:predicted SAM-dependent methyltransferase
MSNKLHLGCGSRYLKGYINVDLPVEKHNIIKPKCDIYCNIMELIFPLESFNEIRSHHVFEHFNRVDALSFLIKCTLWLKQNGILIIETPDAEACAQVICSKTASYTQKMAHVRHLAGSHTAPQDIHVDHWFAERFSHTLPQFGYTVQKLDKTNPRLPNITAIAKRTELLPYEQLIAASKEILLLSIHNNKEHPTYKFWVRNLCENTKLETFIKEE